MVRQYSAALGSSAKSFARAGVFNGFIEVDTKLYIDPHLLDSSSAPEMRKAAKAFRAYFVELITILKHASRPRDPFWRQAHQRLTFHEIPQLSLGYSTDDIRGSAIGSTLAFSITETAQAIVAAGILDPEIFELIGLLEDGIGADRISDMTASVVLQNLLDYSQRMVDDLKLSQRTYPFRGKQYRLPYDQRTAKFKILVPSDILRNLPIAHDWSDIDVVCRHNRQLRQAVNKLIGNTWRKATRKIPKRELKYALIQNPGALRDLIEQYKNKKGTAYDLDADPAGEIIWYTGSHDYAARYPLDLSKYAEVKPDDIFPIVQVLCGRFKQLVEDNGLNQLFYNDSGHLKNERAAQLLFFGVADAYCEANDLDINREPNAGRGPVDFKASHGYKARVNVEIKYSSNPHLLDGYTAQLRTYNKAERTNWSIYLVIQTGTHRNKLEKLGQLRHAATANGERAPELVIIDGRSRPSASKLRRRTSAQ